MWRNANPSNAAWTRFTIHMWKQQELAFCEQTQARKEEGEEEIFLSSPLDSNNVRHCPERARCYECFRRRYPRPNTHAKRLQLMPLAQGQGRYSTHTYPPNPLQLKVDGPRSAMVHSRAVAAGHGTWSVYTPAPGKMSHVLL